METKQSQQWGDLLNKAINEPGIISEAYSAFHSYSLGNQIAAAFQLSAKGLPLAPIASFKAWKDKGRSVRKGEKAIALCMPITCKRENKETGEDDVFARFMWRNNWFSLDQTEGAEFVNEAVSPEWDKAQALTALDISEGRFEMANGNVQGYASGRTIAINPLAVLPHKTRFHEIAHIVLGHTAESVMSDSEITPRDIREVEAEGVAYILCSLLGLPGQAESRGYIQSWLGCQPLTEKTAQRIFSAADKILKAGKLAANMEGE